MGVLEWAQGAAGTVVGGLSGAAHTVSSEVGNLIGSAGRTVSGTIGEASKYVQEIPSFSPASAAPTPSDTRVEFAGESGIDVGPKIQQPTPEIKAEVSPLSTVTSGMDDRSNLPVVDKDVSAKPHIREGGIIQTPE